nr:signal peptidase I [Lachnospiraceae bacterium]
QLFIKRVIGLPGETLEMIDGKIYINHSLTPLDEPYVNKVPYGNYGPVEIPEGAYFVMGDNRNNSADSRYWKNTFVYKEKILGKAWFRYYKKFGPIE